MTVKSYATQNCKHAYTLEVEDQFDLLTPYNQTHATKAPAMGESLEILTGPESCTQCPKLEVGKTYLIAGSYSKAADGSVSWMLDSSNDQSLVSEWSNKYTRKLNGWIESTNAHFSVRSSFVQQCEKNSLISSEQWQLYSQ